MGAEMMRGMGAEAIDELASSGRDARGRQDVGSAAPGRMGMLVSESIAPSRGQGIRSKSGADAQR